jgi:hypothetical protein
MLKRLLLVCGMALALAPVAFAGPTAPTISVSPSPVVLDQQFTISGCGYRSGEQLWVAVDPWSDGGYASADSSGCFSLAWTFSSVSFGPIMFQAISYDASNGKIKSKALAAVWYSVVA